MSASPAEQITAEDFAFFADYARKAAGIVLSENKKHLVISRLSRRVRSLGLSSLSDYRSYLAAQSQQEHTDFVNAITTNLTSFFREEHHFDYFQEWISKAPATRQFHVWSSACSTGQEPYSIAIAASECASSNRVSVSATDIDTQCVSHGKNGVYRLRDVEGLDPTLTKRYFLRGSGQNEGMVRAKDHIRRMVDFKQLNLMKDWPTHVFDVIFCRNVFIYFDEPTQATLLRKFHESLADDGVLFLGHSETVRNCEHLFEQDGRSTFRKV